MKKRGRPKKYSTKEEANAAIVLWRKEHYIKNKDKVRDYSLRRRYNITLEERNKMLEEQGGVCSICDEPMDVVCVDHRHSDGFVRELLCTQCNKGFGCFKEDPRLLEKAAMYARFHNGEKKVK